LAVSASRAIAICSLFTAGAAVLDLASCHILISELAPEVADDVRVLILLGERRTPSGSG